MNAQNIDLVAENENLKVRSKVKISDSLKALIADNKAELLAFLTSHSNEQNGGSPESLEAKPNQDTPKLVPEAEKPFKEYTLADGRVVQLTKEQFQQEVERFRLLLRQDQKLKLGNGVA